MKRKLAAVLLTVALAMTLSPASALAAPLAKGAIDGQSTSAPLATQAKSNMRAVYVVVENAYKNVNPNEHVYDRTTKFTYSENGLVKKGETVLENTCTHEKTYELDKYTYEGINMTSQYRKRYDGDAQSTQEGRCRYTSKNGRIREAVVGKDASGASQKTTVTYNKKGAIKSIIPPKRKDQRDPEAGTYFKTNKKNQIISRTTRPYDASFVTTETYGYDNNSNMVEAHFDTALSTGSHVSYTISYSLTYENGLPESKTTAIGANTASTNAYTYKRIKVPAKYVSAIKRQQWAIINGNIDTALGI